MNVDPENNYYNDIITSCKYYTDQHFNNDPSIKNEVGLSLVHFNARSLSASFCEIQDFLKLLTIQFDITGKGDMVEQRHQSLL